MGPISLRFPTLPTYVLLGIISVAAEQFVEIESDITLTSYRYAQAGQSPRITQRTIPARCVIGLNAWRIDTAASLNAEESYYCDGTNVYRRVKIVRLLDVTEPARGEPITISPDLNDPTIHLAIFPGTHPLGERGVNVAWLAYCSSLYLKVPGRAVPLPGADARYTVDAFGYADSTTLFPDELALPQLVELRTSVSRLEASLADPRIARTSTPARRRVSPALLNAEGELRCRYEVTATTNFMGWVLPSRFQFDQYAPTPEGTMRPHVSASGTLRSLRQASPPENVLGSSGSLHSVMDYRFRSKEKLLDSISYEWTNNHAASVPSVDDEYLVSIYRQQLSRAPRDPSSKVSYELVPLLLLLLLSPFVIYRVLRSKAQTSQQ